MKNKLIYIILFIVILVIILYFSYGYQYLENFVNKSPKIDKKYIPNNLNKKYRYRYNNGNVNKNRSNAHNNPKNNKINDNISNEIRDIRYILNDYVKEVRNLEYKLKMEGIIDDDFKRLDSLSDKDNNLFYTKSIDDKINEDIYEEFISFKNIGSKLAGGALNAVGGKIAGKLGNIGGKLGSSFSSMTKHEIKSLKDQLEDDNKPCPRRRLEGDQVDKLQLSENLKKYINLSGEESIKNMYKTSLEESSHEEKYLGNENIEEIKHVSNLQNGTNVYQYTDKKNNENYRIYQRGNMITLKEDNFIDIISNTNITLNTLKTNRINLDKNKGTKIYSKNRIEMLGSFKNTINLEKNKGINIQSNENITLNQINPGEKQKGQVKLDPNGVKVIHTNKVVLKVGVNVIVIDNDSINLFGENVNIMSSDSTSITTNSLHIDANNMVVNSNVDFLGEVNLLDGVNIDGVFNHRGDSFNSTVTPIKSLVAIASYNKCFDYVKNKNILNINKYQKLGGTDTDKYNNQIVQKISGKVNNIQKLLDDKMMGQFSTIMNLIGLGKYGKNISDAVHLGQPNDLENITTNISIQPGNVNISNNNLGSNIIGGIINSMDQYSTEKLYELFHKVVKILPYDKQSNDILDKLDNEIYKMAMTNNKLLNKYSGSNSDLLINLANTQSRGKDIKESFKSGSLLAQSESLLKDKINKLENKYKGVAEGEIKIQINRIRSILQKNIEEGLENIANYYTKKYSKNIKDPIKGKMAIIFNKLLSSLEKIPAAASSLNINTNSVKLSLGEQSELTVGTLDTNIITPKLNINGPTMSEGKMAECNINTLLYNIVSNETKLESSIIGITGNQNILGDTNFKGNIGVLGGVNIESPEFALAVNAGRNTFAISSESILMDAPLKKFLGGETQIVGANTNINGGLTVQGTTNIMGSSSFEGPVDIVGLLGIEGEITAPTAVIVEIKGTVTNAINSENAENAENADHDNDGFKLSTYMLSLDERTIPGWI